MKNKTIDEYVDDVMIGLLNAVEYTKEADTKLMREVIGNTLREVKNLTIPVVMQRSELLLFAEYYENDKTSETTDEVVDNYLAEKSNSA